MTAPADELFALLAPDDVETLTVPLGELGLARSWGAMVFGSLFENAKTIVQGWLILARGNPTHPLRRDLGFLPSTWQYAPRVPNDEMVEGRPDFTIS